MNHKETTKHIRQRIKKAGIKASVNKYDACGTAYIRVATASYEQQFTVEDQTLISRISKGNGLTCARGDAIDESVPFGNEAHFEFHA